VDSKGGKSTMKWLHHKGFELAKPFLSQYGILFQHYSLIYVFKAEKFRKT